MNSGAVGRARCDQRHPNTKGHGQLRLEAAQRLCHSGIELFGARSERAAFFIITAAAAFSGLLAGADLTPAQVRDRVIGDQRLSRVKAIYQRAHDRGEIDLNRIPAAVLAMPFDLVRHDLLMDLKPLTPKRIRSIIDDLFLPLVHNRVSGTSDPI